MSEETNITQLLFNLNAGEEGAEEALLSLLYTELCGLARSYMRNERADHTLQSTALVHEAYIRLTKGEELNWRDKAHFMSAAAKTMRRVLIDHSRKKNTDKRGKDFKFAPLDRAAELMEASCFDLVALDSALTRLSEIDPQLAKVVELRFFGGLTIKETARVLDISPTTVKTEWITAKAWLRQDLGS